MLILLAAQASAADADRAFAADAERRGQWTAFRTWAAPDAIMFAPQPVPAATFLKDRKDPATPLHWTPVLSYVSCDGKAAVNTGPWIDQAEQRGYFSTVWVKQPAGAWRWVIDGGDMPQVQREPVDPKTRTATCGRPVAAASLAPPAGGKAGHGASPDGTLRWAWTVAPDGERHFVTDLWTGRAFDRVIDDHIPGTPRRK